MFRFSKNELLKDALRLYAGEHVLERVLSLGEKAFDQTFERREVTLLSVDIASIQGVDSLPDSSGYTDIYSKLIRPYLDVVTSHVVDHGGVVDTLNGEAVLAYWEQDGHPERACACALGLLVKLSDLNASNQADGLPQVRVRIGINTGHVNLGNHGASRRLRYGVAGDAVNTAWSLCGTANGYYSFPVVIAEETKLRLPSLFNAVEIETVQVKGREGGMKVYGLNNT